MERKVIAKIKLLGQLGIAVTREQHEWLSESENEFQLERRVRDIINPPERRAHYVH